MLVTLFHGFASAIDNAFVQKPGKLQAALKGVPEKIRELYDENKIAALAEGAIESVGKDGRISCVQCYIAKAVIDG